MTDVRIRTALISVTDKSHLEELAGCLISLPCRILSSGGTAAFLSGLGLPVESVSSRTGFPEILDGRVKTLHPKVHGGLLAVRGNPEHERQLLEHGIEPIDLVAVNLYPFAQTVSRPGRTVAEVIENIDIGGPSMIRSAAKNFESVAVLTDPADYAQAIQELREKHGALGRDTRLRLARKAFEVTAEYDHHVQAFLTGLSAPGPGVVEEPESRELPESQVLRLRRVWPLRYGENPHQRAAFYREAAHPPRGLARGIVLQGKEISYNNLLDLDAAIGLASEFEEPAAVIIKHTNPCGTALGQDILTAYGRAREADPVSAFGSVIALNRAVEEDCARAVTEGFVEVLAAPSFGAGAREVFRTRKNLRLVEVSDFRSAGARWRSVAGGFLVQEADQSVEGRDSCRVVTRRQPTEAEWADLWFSWKVVKHVKSNAIVLARDRVTAGVGAGQMSRVEAVEIAVRKAGPRAAGCVLGSDAFFPFRDNIDAAAAAGVRAVIQPGGSVRDAEAIAAADEHGLTMVFTGIRHFRH